MVNNENSQITFFMQNLSNKMDEVIKNVKITASKFETEEKVSMHIDPYFKLIREKLNKLDINNENILKKIEVSKPHKILSPIKNYQTNIVNYNLLDTDFYKKHQKKIITITLVLFFIPSFYYIYKTSILRNELENYKTFYTYFKLINLEKADIKNLNNIKVCFDQIKNNDEDFLKKYNDLIKIYSIKK